MFLRFQKVLGGLLVALTITGCSWASCGSSSCPIDLSLAERTERGVIRLDYTQEYIDQSQPKMSRRNAAVGEIRGHHDEVFTINEIKKISLDAGLTDRLSLQLILPFVHREHYHVHHHHGSDEHEYWNLNGMGDLTVLSRYAFTHLSVIAGGVFPTGRDKALNDTGEEAEAGILPGKGTYSLILGGSLTKNFTAKTWNGLYAKLPVFFSSTYQWNGRSDHDYKIGNIWLANAGGVYPVLPKVGLMLQSNVLVSRRDSKGRTGEEVKKTGGTFVYISPGLQLALAENLWSTFMVQFPVYQRVNVIQLTSDNNIILGVSYRFSVL